MATSLDILHHNLNLLAEKNPPLALQLRWGQPLTWQPEEVAIPAAEVTFCLGFPRCALEILKQGRKLICIDVAGALLAFLNSPQATSFLEAGGELALPDQAEQLATTYAGRPCTFAATPSHRRDDPLLCQTLHHQLLRSHAVSSQVLTEFETAGELYYRNAYSNFLHWPSAFQSTPFADAFKGVPAIICGAGPSLDRNGHLLQTVGDRALIFAGGSALNALNARGIQPHFGAGCDPNPDQFERLMTNTAFDLPMFYNSRWIKEAMSVVYGPKIYLNGVACYPLAHWLEEELGIPGIHLDGGHNVVNLTLELACAMGCDPLILVGLDLAFTGNATYADGVVANRTSGDGELICDDIHGQPIATQWKWLSEAHWISELAANHPQKAFLNATEGGIGFAGIPNVSLQEALAGCENPSPLKEQIASRLQPLPVTYEQVKAKLEALKESLDRTIDRLERLRIHPNPLDEVELEEEIAYRVFLDNLARIESLELDLLSAACHHRKWLEEALSEPPPLSGRMQVERGEQGVECFAPNGQRVRLVEIASGMRHGRDCLYDEDGTLLMEAQYEQGKLLSRRWIVDGKCIEQPFRQECR